MKLAPIILFTFNRLEHTKETINHLKKNLLANESELYIFSDGARNRAEEKKVNEVREYLKGIDGFKKVEVIESNENKGLAKSVICGVSSIIDEYEKVIVIEDDIVTSKYFLTYMNKALELYEDRLDIWSISGYTPNIDIPNYYEEEVYLTKRGCSWGWGTWKDRWVEVDWDINDYKYWKKDKKRKNKFNESGTDMSPMLEDQMKGRINSWAIRWVYSQNKLNKLTVYPTKSLVRNIGNDLSGTHTPITNKYNVNLFDNNIKLNKNIEINYNICSKFKKNYDLNFIGYIALAVKKVGLYKPARMFRNKIMKVMKKS